MIHYNVFPGVVGAGISGAVGGFAGPVTRIYFKW